MNKLRVIILTIAAVFLCATAHAQVWVNGSGNQSADALIFTGEANFFGIYIATDGTNACTVSVYDNTTNSGKLLFPTTAVTTSATDRVRGIAFPTPVRANNGIYVDITTAGTCNYAVYYAR